MKVENVYDFRSGIQYTAFISPTLIAHHGTMVRHVSPFPCATVGQVVSNPLPIGPLHLSRHPSNKAQCLAFWSRE